MSLWQYIVVPAAIEDELEQLFEAVLAIGASLRQSRRVDPRAQGLSLPALGVMKLLHRHDGLTVPQIARQRGTSRQNIQVLVDRLAEAGLVEYVANPDHQRSERLKLTSAGRRSHTSAIHRQATWLAELLPQVTEEELRSCIGLLGRIREKLGGRKQAGARPVKRISKKRSKEKLPPPVQRVEPVVESAPEELPDDSPPAEFPVNLL